MNSITSRHFIETDEEELNALYNLVAGRSRTIQQFRWEWLNSPEGWGSMWLMVDNNLSVIIGHHGLIPLKFNYFENTIMAGKTENTVMHPQYRGKGIYQAFEVKFLEEARDKFQLLFTTAGSKEAGSIRVKLGYVIVGGYDNFIKVIDWRGSSKWVTGIVKIVVHNISIATLLRWAYRLGSIFLIPFFHGSGSIDKEIILEKIGEINLVADEWDNFWQLNKENYAITVDRSSRYLKWRIFDNPNLVNDFYLARLQGNIVGYIITREFGENGATIVDIIAQNNSSVIFNTILDRIVGILRQKGTSVVHMITLHSKDVLNEALKGNGFISFHVLEQIVTRFFKNRPSVLMAKVLFDGLDVTKASDPNHWYFTDILSEGR